MKSKLPGLRLILIIIPLVLVSWLLIHIFAIFGIFLAVAYPLWWLFVSQRTACLLCRAGKEGSICPFCKRPIKRNERVSPSNLSSAIYNGILILAFSLMSIGIVFGESKLLFRMGFPPTPKTVSFVIPTKGQYRLGEIFPMKIEIAGIKTPINAVQADLGFEQSKVEVVDISTKDSFANIFVQKEISNEGGYARLTGGLPNPGFFSDKGLFGIVFFKSKSPGIIKIEFLPSSMVLANDSRGTNVLKDLTSVSYLVLPEKISEEEEKMQKSITLQSSVLGESTNSTQMKFYEETGILGASAEREIKKEQQRNLVGVSLDVLEKIDGFVISGWQNVFSLFKSI